MLLKICSILYLINILGICKNIATSGLDTEPKGHAMPPADLVKVICVDDQESMLRLHRYAFLQLGIRKVTECTSAEAAMEAVLSTDFDLMTLDWNMPAGTDGLTLFKMLRGNPRTAKLPIVMVTGNAEEHSVTFRASP